MTTRKLEIRVDQTGDAKAGLTGIVEKFGGVKGLAFGAAGALAVLGGGTLAAGAGLISLGSDAEEMQGKFDIVFKEGAASATKALDEFGNAVGRNTFDLMGMAAGLQDTFVPLGFARDKAQDMSVAVTKLAVDLGSFNNISEQTVAADLQSALTGETEVMKKYGVVINQAAIEQEAMRLGLIENKNELDAQSKAQATLSLIMKGTSDAQGDAARTSGSWANQMRGLKAELGEAATSMGKELLPVVVPFLKEVLTLAKDALPKAVEIFKAWSAEMKASLGPAMVIIKDAIDRITVALGGQKGSVDLTKITLAAFKAVLDSVVIAIKLAAIAIKLLADGVEQGRRNFETIKGAVNSVRSTFDSMVNSMKNGLNYVIGKWNDFKNAVKNATSSIPRWLIPHSPTQFEMGLRGIAKSATEAGRSMAQFASPVAGVSMAGAGSSGNGQIVVNLTYSPMFSMADRMEAEKQLIPFIQQAVRGLK